MICEGVDAAGRHLNWAGEFLNGKKFYVLFRELWAEKTRAISTPRTGTRPTGDCGVAAKLSLPFAKAQKWLGPLNRRPQEATLS